MSINGLELFKHLYYITKYNVCNTIFQNKIHHHIISVNNVIKLNNFIVEESEIYYNNVVTFLRWKKV